MYAVAQLSRSFEVELFRSLQHFRFKFPNEFLRHKLLFGRNPHRLTFNLSCRDFFFDTSANGFLNRLVDFWFALIAFATWLPFAFAL